MKKDMLSVLCGENEEYTAVLSRYMSEESEVVVTDTSVVPSTNRATLHGHLSVECLVDNVYIRLLVPPGLTETQDLDSRNPWKEMYIDDIGGRDLSRFVESLQTSISSSKLIIEHIVRSGNTQTQSASTGIHAGVSGLLTVLRAHLLLKERVLTQILANHDELGYAYADLYLDT